MTTEWTLYFEGCRHLAVASTPLPPNAGLSKPLPFSISPARRRVLRPTTYLHCTLKLSQEHDLELLRNFDEELGRIQER